VAALWTWFWYPKNVVRMLWWFLILAGSGAAALWAGTAAYLRVRRQMKSPVAAIAKKSEVEQEADGLKGWDGGHS